MRAAGRLFLSAPRPGRLVSLDLDAWAGRPGVARYEPRLTPGTQVRPAENSGDRLAWAVLDCATPAELSALAAELRAGAGVVTAEGT